MRSSLADYQLLGPFGPGGEQDGTWLARPPERLGAVGSTVVITEIPDPGAGGWDELAGKLADLGAVRNEHLPTLIEAGRTQESDGYVAWVSRVDADARPFTPADGQEQAALRAVAGAARAAHALHQAGWAHGDIRPAAVLVAHDKVLLAPPLATAAQRAELAGPPRTAADLDPVDPNGLWGEGPSRAGDVWSLGATAHALVARRPVHPALAGDPIVTAVQRVLIEAPQVAPDLDAELDTLLRSCFAPDPADRPQSAADLADRLERLADAT